MGLGFWQKVLEGYRLLNQLLPILLEATTVGKRIPAIRLNIQGRVLLIEGVRDATSNDVRVSIR